MSSEKESVGQSVATSTIKETDGKLALATEQSYNDAALDTLRMPAGIDPELAAAVAAIPPERRAEIEKRVKLKIDCFLFPMLLAFYILNYIVSQLGPIWIYQS